MRVAGHSSTIWALALAFVLAPLAILVVPASAGWAIALAWSAVALFVLARLWGRRGGRYVVFVYSDNPDWMAFAEADLLPRLPENAGVLNWSERARWPLWSVAVWAFTLLGGRRAFTPLGIVFRRWRLPRVFRFWRIDRDSTHGTVEPQALAGRQFLEAAGPGPAVELSDEGPGGAALSWTGPRARAVALELFVELARRLEGEPGIERLRLEGEVGEPVDVDSIDAFVRAVPLLLTRLYAGFTFEFRLNDGTRVYRLWHLDRRAHGVRFETPEEGEPFWDALGEVLSDFAARSPDVTVSAGPWYEDSRPFR